LKKFNINNFFHFLSIRTKLIVAFSLLAFVPLSIIGTVGFVNNIKTMHTKTLENLQHDIELVSERTGMFLSNINIDIQFISTLYSFRNYVERATLAKRNYQGPNYQAVVEELSSLLRTKNHYFQIRFIDGDQQERFRIVRGPHGIQITPHDQLSNSKFHYYFLLTDSTRQGQIVFLPIEIFDRNSGTIPAFSFAMRIYNSDKDFLGILIADVFAKDLFRIIETGAHHEFERKLVLVNEEGNYLYHSEKKKNWNRLLAARETENLFKEFPKEFSKQIISGDSGIISKGFDEIAVYSTLFQTGLPVGHSYYIFETVKKTQIYQPLKKYAVLFLGFVILFLIVSIFLGVVATTQLAGPIQKLRKGAATISDGNYNYRIEIETNDEIEQLADQFNRMAKALAVREQLLANQQQKLEKMVLARTKELSDEKEKLQAILDNIPSAVLLMDQSGVVLAASAAIQKFSGFIAAHIIGKKCYQIFSSESYCKNCYFNSENSFSKTGSFIESSIDQEGKPVYIEHVIVPLAIENKKYAVLEILTDISERKQLEEHMLKTEKLIATGEMSAIIAHEIRNSLTSVKMIMQLQRESSHLEEEQQSLDVAIQSILRAEDVVNNLLRFARPSPYNFTNANVNDLLQDSLLLIQPQIKKKKIQINKQFDVSAPNIHIDVNRLKDVFVNILLNAVQAINKNGRIELKCKVVQLKQKIEEVAYPNIKSDFHNAANFKVILQKNQKVFYIEIGDDGAGISAKGMNRIFDPFYTTKVNGTGLGLAIAKRTINEHGGIIQVASKERIGTVFSVFLPIGKDI
jgi:PAS domain S-box-containing protein